MRIKQIEAAYSESYEQKASVNYQTKGKSFFRSIKLVAELTKGENIDECELELSNKAKGYVKKQLKQDRDESEAHETSKEAIQV